MTLIKALWGYSYAHSCLLHPLYGHFCAMGHEPRTCNAWSVY